MENDMKVSELPYKRVTIEEASSVMEDVIRRIREAGSADEVLAAREDYLPLLRDYMTAASLSYMRYSINTVDEFYVAEKDYYDETGPQFNNYMVALASALLDSPFRAELEEKLSPVLFRSMEVARKSMSEEIIPDMIEENKLVSEYSQLMAGMEFEFRGEKMPRAVLAGYFKDDDRATRREAYEVLGRTLEQNKAELDRLFDELVHVRDRMAKKMGYKNFVELGYYRMGRLCYDEKMVAAFRENILRDIVPVVSRLRTENAKRLGVDKYMFYDDGVIIPGGDPRPVGGKENIFASAREMYHAMSPESAAFIDMMLENEAFDVDSRKNKWGGGYCTEFAAYKQPFILANFNGTAGDVDVVTHEAGHAFNAYLIADNRFALELGCGGMETAETHSMSMEFFAWPYMDRFFGADADKYRYMHALESFSFLPYGTIVDYFQHLVYENPDMTPDERDALWLRLESKFRPRAGSIRCTSTRAPSTTSTTCSRRPRPSTSCSPRKRTMTTPSRATCVCRSTAARWCGPICLRRPASRRPSSPARSRPSPARSRACSGRSGCDPKTKKRLKACSFSRFFVGVTAPRSAPRAARQRRRRPRRRRSGG